MHAAATPADAPARLDLCCAPWDEDRDAVLFALALASTLPAPTDPPLRWEAPSVCPERATIERRILELTGATDVPASMRGDARVRATDGGLLLTIDVRTPSGRSHKSIHGTDCQVLAEVTALMVAVALEPTSVSGRLPPPPSDEPPTDVPPPPSADRPPTAATRSAPPPRRPDPPARVEDERPPVTGVLGASFALGRGLVPSFDGRIALSPSTTAGSSPRATSSTARAGRPCGVCPPKARSRRAMSTPSPAPTKATTPRSLGSRRRRRASPPSSPARTPRPSSA